jgi:hypothetical protein
LIIRVNVDEDGDWDVVFEEDEEDDDDEPALAACAAILDIIVERSRGRTALRAARALGMLCQDVEEWVVN